MSWVSWLFAIEFFFDKLTDKRCQRFLPHHGFTLGKVM